MKERASSPEEIAGSWRRLIAVLGVQTRDFFAKNDGKGTLGRKSLGKCWRQGDGSSWEEIHIEGLPRGFWGWAVRRDFRNIRRGGCVGGLAGDGSSLSFLEQTRLTSPSCLPSQSWRFPKIVEDRKGNFRNVRRQIGLGGGVMTHGPTLKVVGRCLLHFEDCVRAFSVKSESSRGEKWDETSTWAELGEGVVPLPRQRKTCCPSVQGWHGSEILHLHVSSVV